MKYFVLITGLIVFAGCNGKNTGINPENNLNKYPAKLNYRWEYSTSMSNEFYDNTGNIDSTQTTNLPNTTVKISSVNDSLPGYKNLIRIDAYNDASPGSVSENWYINDDTVFSIIAYRNAGSSYPIIPKPSSKRHLTLAEFKEICQNLTFNFRINSNYADSVRYFDPPRVVLRYPLYPGAEWNELQSPFYRDRIVIGTVSLKVNNVYYNCFIVEADMPELKLKMIDYISYQAGLLKREISSDSVALVSINSPDSAIGYLRGHDVSILVNKNF